ncbi:hypothetical protein J2X61_007232 [Bacillus sp. 3255]|nr:hypothetical protein [Bacillus sp. 3255]
MAEQGVLVNVGLLELYLIVTVSGKGVISHTALS